MKLEEAFRCPVVSRYSNMENGFIANQRKGELEYRINTASFIVEILDMNSDKVVPEGSVGRIVVTDLFNKAMPLIRYDTGDIGSKVIINGEQYLNTIEGRKTDLIYNTNGLPVSVHIISNTMWEYDDLNQYQFIQVGKEHYIMKLNFDGDFTKEKQLEEKLKSYLGNNANIVFEYVKEIPVLHSGKRKYIANEYYKD
jgi:phenylacetate-CoA ligase